MQDVAAVKAHLEEGDRLHGAEEEGHKEDLREDKGVNPEGQLEGWTPPTKVKHPPR